MATKKSKAVVKKGKTTKELAPGELQKLANAGTKEAIAKIEQYLKIEKDEEKSAYAEMALEECEYLYYQPTSEKEDEEFMLVELIRRRENDLEDLMVEAGSVQMKLDKLMLEKKIHDKILAKNKDMKEVWKYNYIPDMLITEQDAMQQLEDVIGYEEAWIAEARKLVTTPRYKTIPAHYLERFSFDFDQDDAVDFEDDDEIMDIDDADEANFEGECGCGDDDCCSDESCDCGDDCGCEE